MAVRKIFCVFQKVIPLLIKDSQARVDGSITWLNSYRHTRPSALPQALISSGNRYSSGVQGATSLLRLASLTEGGTEKTPSWGLQLNQGVLSQRAKVQHPGAHSTARRRASGLELPCSSGTFSGTLSTEVLDYS